VVETFETTSKPINIESTKIVKITME